jgi:lysozyme family protein
MTEQIVLPTGVRGYVRELQAQIQALSERAANLAANLAAANEQNELQLARIDALQHERETQAAAGPRTESLTRLIHRSTQSQLWPPLGGLFIWRAVMAASTYDEALRRLLIHEGGYTNHPSDPGGPTNFGITIADYRKYAKPDATAADVRAMSVDEAKAIYRKRYWDAQRCDELPGGVDYSVFDYGVNSGIGRSGKVLRRVVGLPDDRSVVTDQVLAYTRARDPKVLIAAICDERLAFLKSLKTWPVFGHGWGTRVAEVKTVSLALAGAAQGVTPSPAPAAIAGTPPWLARMNAILGLYEFPGAADNPAIVAMAKACGGNIAKSYRHDATPWCALTVNYCLITSGLPNGSTSQPGRASWPALLNEGAQGVACLGAQIDREQFGRFGIVFDL